jgi:hypothetical protein
LSHLANARRVRPAYKLGRSLPFRNYDTCTFKPLFPLFAHAGGVGLGPEGSLRVEPVQSVCGTLRVEPGGPGPQPPPGNFFLFSLFKHKCFLHHGPQGPWVPPGPSRFCSDPLGFPRTSRFCPDPLRIGKIIADMPLPWGMRDARYLRLIAHCYMSDAP